MAAINLELAEILQTVSRPGDFYTTGRSEAYAPDLEVAGVGTIALPLLPAQAAQLIGVAERAPYGRGEDTLVDTEVRRTWQIGVDRIRVGGRHWARSLAAIVERCAAGLGVAGPVSAELYKMLIYDTGSFFVGHRDTEKTPGMFATLVVVLPSKYTGGELVVRHRGREACLDLVGPDAGEVAFAAFYADCVHEVRPVTSGCRLALVYNLIRSGSLRAVEPPSYDAARERLTALLRRWSAGPDAADGPDKLIYPLEHVYTQAELGFAGLKNADAARAAVLAAAAAAADCALHLALVAIEESGSAEYTGGWRRYGYRDAMDEAAFEVGEVCERSLTLSHWRRPDGDMPELPELPFEDDELCPPDAFDNEEPDEQLFFEATGNAGASFERSYRRAALVLWPQGRTLEIVAAAGLPVALPYLESLTARWVASGADTDSAGWREAVRLLASLNRLRDTTSIAALLADVFARGCYGSGDNEALADAVALLPAAQAASLVERIVARNASWHAGACARLLALTADRLAAAGEGEAAGRAAVALLAALPGDPARASAPGGWPRPDPVVPELVADLLEALHRLSALATGERVVDHVLAWPAAFDADRILVPAALKLAAHAGPLRHWAPTRRLVEACTAHLDRRLAEPLAPPADFARPSEIACRCPHCTDLSAFLADPRREVWVFRAAEAQRRHVEDSIRRHDCDVDTETERRGRPYALVCTKNSKSYQRRVAQREKDRRDRVQLSLPSAA